MVDRFNNQHIASVVQSQFFSKNVFSKNFTIDVLSSDFFEILINQILCNIDQKFQKDLKSAIEKNIERFSLSLVGSLESAIINCDIQENYLNTNKFEHIIQIFGDFFQNYLLDLSGLFNIFPDECDFYDLVCKSIAQNKEHLLKPVTVTTIATAGKSTANSFYKYVITGRLKDFDKYPEVAKKLRALLLKVAKQKNLTYQPFPKALHINQVVQDGLAQVVTDLVVQNPELSDREFKKFLKGVLDRLKIFEGNPQRDTLEYYKLRDVIKHHAQKIADTNDLKLDFNMQVRPIKLDYIDINQPLTKELSMPKEPTKKENNLDKSASKPLKGNVFKTKEKGVLKGNVFKKKINK